MNTLVTESFELLSAEIVERRMLGKTSTFTILNTTRITFTPEECFYQKDSDLVVSPVDRVLFWVMLALAADLLYREYRQND